MKLRLPRLLVLGVLASALLVTAASAATTVFATVGVSVNTPESITPTASGFLVTDANAGEIWGVPATGGSATQRSTCPDSLRGGLILPSTFGAAGGKFLAVGRDTGTGDAVACTMDTSTFATSSYQSQANGVWTEAVLAPSFGSLSGDVLVTNQGSATTNGSVDYFTPSGGVGTLATFSSSAVIPFGAALAKPSFGEVGGPSLFVSDAGSGGIYTVDTHGNIKLFTTIPLDATAGQDSLRQIAFAPKEWKRYGGDLFVTLNTGAIDVVNRDGVVIGKISGAFNARGLLFTTMAGKPTLLFSNTAGHNILKAGPGDIVPS
jgi:hypothetical protein